MDLRECVICLEKYQPKVVNQKICWKECRRILSNRSPVERNKTYEWKLRRKQHALNDYAKNKEKIKKRVRNWKPYHHTCIECWKEFNSWRKTAKFCSNKCFHNLEKIVRLWKNNPVYRNWLYTKGNDINKTRVWQTRFIKVCKELDKKIEDKYGYLCCENCWTTNSLRFEHHHIIYRSEKPKHKELHNIKNILYLCIKCHNEFHKHKWKRNKIVEERKLNELFWDDILSK